jgi:hypothetical protein
VALQASQQPPKQQEQNAQAAQNQNTNTDPKTENSSENKSKWWTGYPEQIKSYWYSFIDLAERREKTLVGIGTLFIAIFTIALVFATFFLWWATKRLVSEAKISGELQSRATTQLVSEAKTSGELQSRAYLVVKPASFGVENGQPLVQIGCGNLGQTTALRVRVFASMDVFPFSPATTVQPIPSVTRTKNPEVFMQPKDSMNFPVRPDGPFTPNQIQQIINGNDHRLYIFGHVDYEDVYGKPHGTPFVVTLSGGPLVKNLFAGVPSPQDWRVRFELAAANSNPY